MNHDHRLLLASFITMFYKLFIKIIQIKWVRTSSYITVRVPVHTVVSSSTVPVPGGTGWYLVFSLHTRSLSTLAALR